MVKMDKEQEQTVVEQEPLLAECKLYKGEPETKGPPTQNLRLRDLRHRENEEETVRGLPVGPERTPAVVGASVPRIPWSTGLFQCFGSGDEHFSNDLEVCVLAFAAPCVLYGSNMERLHYPVPERLASVHCLQYCCLYGLGAISLCTNNSVPCYSSTSRILLRKKYNLEGHTQYCLGWPCGTPSEACTERCDLVCDLFIHGFLPIHPFALAQEGRELRRRTLPPNVMSALLAMAPPMKQSMTP